jgi:hypothetical protein
MGLVLDSAVPIAAERDARPASGLLATLEQEHGKDRRRRETDRACDPVPGPLMNSPLRSNKSTGKTEIVFS